MKTALLLITTLCAGCAVSAGVGYQFSGKPEIDLDSCVGIVRAERATRFGSVGCEHVSGCESREQGYGLNWCGAMIKFGK